MNDWTQRVVVHTGLGYWAEAESRRRDLLRAVEQEHLARQIVRPRRLRRRMGRLLIAIGEAIAGGPVRPVRSRGGTAPG
jgi:hypothetical protein